MFSQVLAWLLNNTHTQGRLKSHVCGAGNYEKSRLLATGVEKQVRDWGSLSQTALSIPQAVLYPSIAVRVGAADPVLPNKGALLRAKGKTEVDLLQRNENWPLYTGSDWPLNKLPERLWVYILQRNITKPQVSTVYKLLYQHSFFQDLEDVIYY